MSLRSVINPLGAIGFGWASGFAVTQSWSLPEFCWSTWLAGLLYAWVCLLAVGLRLILSARAEQSAYAQRLPFLRRLSPMAFLGVVTAVAVGVGLLAFRISCYVFGFYGLFLSVFAEMEPHALFGRNGFINSDFYTPVVYLVERFWPMAVGLAFANADLFLQRQPWTQAMLPLRREVLRMHAMVLALPFFALFSWGLFRDRYQTATILLLMGLLYLLPRRQPKAGPSAEKA